MKDAVSLDLKNGRKIVTTCKALSSEKRMEILELLESGPLNINEIAERMAMPPSSAAMHVKVLEDAELISTELMPGVRGSMKVCKKIVNQVHIILEKQEKKKDRVELVSMPIGNFVDYDVSPTCGIVGKYGHIDDEDEPRCFYNPERTQAQLLWFGKGYLEYRFPNVGVDEGALKRVEISAELCSETADYDLNCPSDITLWVNGLEAGTYSCPSDFGGRRGKLNPDWWPDKNTQFGILKTWVIDGEGAGLDGRRTSEAGLAAYGLTEKPYISVRIGVKDDAAHVGGVNIFGEEFGDYPQNIVMKFFY